MKKLIISLGILGLTACSTPKLHKDVKLGNESNDMMQCKILCDSNEKPYAFTNNGLKCQCQVPVAEGRAISGPVIRFEVVSEKDGIKGVMGDLMDGRRIMSVVPKVD